MMNKKLKFCLELDSVGNFKVDIEGNGAEVGQYLFAFFFMNAENKAIPYAVGINTALELSYPHVNKCKK